MFEKCVDSNSEFLFFDVFEADVSDNGAFVPSELCLAETCIDKVTANICEDTCSCCILESLGRRVSHAYFYPYFASFFNMVGQCSGGAPKPFGKSVDFHGKLFTVEVLGQDSSVVCTSVAKFLDILLRG